MENMSPEMREKYSLLSNDNVKLQKTIDQIQKELDTIAKEKILLEQQISSSPVNNMNLIKLHDCIDDRTNIPYTSPTKYSSYSF